MLINLRNNILNFAERIINKTNLSKKSIGVLLRSFHFAIPIIMTILLIIGSSEIFTIVIIFNIFVFILFFIFDGCILSRLEQKFTDDDFTVIDPFLELINVETTNENRKWYSFYSSICGFIFIFGLYYYRFYYSVTNSNNII